MPEENTKPNWKIPGLWSAALLIVSLGEIAIPHIFAGKTQANAHVLWNLAKLIIGSITAATWATQFKVSSYLNTPSKIEYRASISFFLVFLIVEAGAAGMMVVQGKEKAMAAHAMTVPIIFFSLWFMLLCRAALISIVRLVSGKGLELKRRVATGFSDAAIIAALAAMAFVRTANFRFIILAVVFGGIRAAWGFVPEERIEIVQEFAIFLKERKLWWMTPIFLILGLLVVLVLLTESTGGSFPFIYAVF